MTTTLDANLMLYKYLTAGATLMATVSNRLYGSPDIPPGITAPCKFLLFFGDGGPGHPDVQMSTQRWSFHAYGEDQVEAQQVYRDLHDRLQRAWNQRVTLAAGSVALLRTANRALGPLDLPEPITNWPRVIAAYEVTFCETAFSA